MNNVQLIGRLAADPELYKTQTGKSVVKFRVAVNRLKRDDPADFISCIAWNQTAEAISQYTGKGLRVAIQGSIQTGSYEKDGRTVYTTDVVIHRVDFLDYRNSVSQQAQQPGYSGSGNQQDTTTGSVAGDDFKLDIESDDLPF